MGNGNGGDQKPNEIGDHSLGQGLKRLAVYLLIGWMFGDFSILLMATRNPAFTS